MHGDIGDNRFYSYGGTDTFHGSAGKDVFILSKRSYDSDLDHKILLKITKKVRK